MAYKYIQFVFAQDGDVSPIPDATQPSGSVSYQQGFGSKYSLPYPSDPASLPVPRVTMNQVLSDLSSIVQEYEQYGTPVFITPLMNGGIPFQYSQWAYALFDAGDSLGPQIYQSTQNINTNTPAVGSGNPLVNPGWSLRDDTASKNTLDNVDFQAGVLQNDVVFYDITVSKYNKAVANGTVAQNFIGLADVARGRIITFGTYNYFTGLTPGAKYYLSPSVYGGITTSAPIMNVAPVGIAVSTTQLMVIPGYGNLQSSSSGGVPTGTLIDFMGPGLPTGYLSCDGSAVSRATYAALFSTIGTLYGAGDGSTTFNLPLMTRRTTLGEGGTIPVGASISNTLGSSGGEEQHVITVAQMPVHDHPGSNFPTIITNPLVIVQDFPRIMVTSTKVGLSEFPIYIAPQGGNQPTNLISPSLICRKLIKT